MNDELETFLNFWNHEANKTAELLRTLPAGQYDFRPDPQARSLGELAWHLARSMPIPLGASSRADFSWPAPSRHRAATND